MKRTLQQTLRCTCACRPPSRRWHGAPSRATCWPRAAARPTGASSSGTRTRAQCSARSTRARRCALAGSEPPWAGCAPLRERGSRATAPGELSGGVPARLEWCWGGKAAADQGGHRRGLRVIGSVGAAAGDVLSCWWSPVGWLAGGCTQVCSLQWSRHEREILSSHGFSKNQLCLWKYPSLVKVRHGAVFSLLFS